MHKKMIYVLEDDPDISELITFILSEAGYDVEECGSVDRFNEKLRNRVPDIFILDVLLPDGNGMDVCRQLRNIEKTAMTPILVMSAHTSRQEVQAAGCANDFIAKPFNIDHFRKRVDDFAN